MTKNRKPTLDDATVLPLQDGDHVNPDEQIADQALKPRNDETLAEYKKDPSRPVHPGSHNVAQGNPSGQNEGLSSV